MVKISPFSYSVMSCFFYIYDTHEDLNIISMRHTHMGMVSLISRGELMGFKFKFRACLISKSGRSELMDPSDL